ncbi:hypothetical protein D3C76_1813630 [compost metagenome]
MTQGSKGFALALVDGIQDVADVQVPNLSQVVDQVLLCSEVVIVQCNIIFMVHVWLLVWRA